MHQAHIPSTEVPPSEPSGANEPRDRLLSTTFIALLLTQFFGTTNDNILRWLVIGIGKELVRPEQASTVLSFGSACLVLPYLLLAAPAGYLADRFSKRSVIIWCKVAEIALMLLATLVIGHVYAMFMTVALIGCQAALFGPAKFGSIPEMLRSNKISSANGILGLTTVVSTALGSAIGNWLAVVSGVVVNGKLHPEGWWSHMFVLVGVAVAGLVSSLMIMPLKPANPKRQFPWDMVGQTIRDLKTLGHDRGLLRVAIGIMFFWTLAMLAHLNIDQFAWEGYIIKQTQVTPLLGALIVGVGIGSVLAGLWSGGKVELGILPIGAGGLALFSFLLYTVQGVFVGPAGHYTVSYFAACFFLTLLGVSSGLFDVPLAAYMQDRSPPEHRGSILAASNFLTFGGMLIASLGYWILRRPVDGSALFSSREIFLLCGLATIPVFIYIVVLIPQATIKFLAWLTTHSIYRIHVYNRENIPKQGGAILVPNHISWLDGLLLFATSSRTIRMLIDSDIITSWRAHGFATMMGAIPIKPSPKSTKQAIETAREALKAGELVCIFPEGGISRSGQLQRFKAGVLEIQRDTGAPIIPVYLDELWGSIFSFRGGKFFWKWPSLKPRRVSIWFGKPIAQPRDIHEVRQAVQDLGADAVAGRKQRTLALPRAMIRNCRKAMFRSKVSDSTGVELTGGKLLAATFVFRRLLLRHVLTPDEKYVGILLPPSVGSVITNAALSMTGRVTANLNYTATPDVLNSCIGRAGIRRILTSRKVMANPVFEKFKDTLKVEFVYLEDLREKALRGDKLYGAACAFIAPAFLLDWVLGLRRISGDDIATVVFTSGSTGMPKGVMLTHHNIATNVEAIEQVVHPRPSDSILGIVPFFHSLGFTVTLWGPLLLDIRAAYHVGHPTDTRIVARLARMRSASILLATPTFLRMYLRRCDPEELSSLEVVVAGAEKMPISLCDAFEKKFGIRPVEGYGTTELSPLVSVNVPPSRSKSATIDCKEGSVGRPVPAVSVKAVDPETYEDLPLGTPGMLLVKGPNVMKGYLGQPEETAKVMHDGWYITGDIAMIDTDGFIHITGRLSRFSKIGGEMVPHIRIEEAIQKILGVEESTQLCVVVTSVPDERKGERLIVVHTPLTLAPKEICEQLTKIGVPNLWIPDADSFMEVDVIPVLGSGKTDLKGVSDLAKARFGK
jgi:acyl-[acyl-carrier-protein]-phospholipid O-acyltransferase/long-chain-fatty-acid--[acyl-carrier-protein] ligase